jgi:hypothetical protein
VVWGCLHPLYSGVGCLARSEALTNAWNTPGQARAENSGGKPPHSTWSGELGIQSE